MSQVRLADGVGASARAAEQPPGVPALDRRLDVLEDVALSDDHAAVVNLKGVARVIVPEVVDGVEEGVAGDLGATAGGVVDVVVLEGDELSRIEL